MTKSSNKREKIFCSSCLNKNINPKCDCVFIDEKRPYFCGNCNGHVKGIEARKAIPIIKAIKKAKIILEGVADYSWKGI